MSENNLIDQEEVKEDNSIKELFTLENATKYYKYYSEANSFKCSWIFEGELLQFAYKSGGELVVERLHIDDLEDAGDWDHIGFEHGTEMIFSLNNLKDLAKFMEDD